MRTALAAVALAAAAVVVWAVAPTLPNYDTYYHLVWGRELLDGVKPTFEAYQAPTEHPLYLGIATVMAQLGGDDADRLMVLLAVLSHAAFVVGVYALGAAVFCRPVGLLAALLAGSSFALLLYAARAYVDSPFLALVVWAAALEAQRPRRGLAPLGLLALAGLLRPEAWVLAGAYWLWLRDWRLLPLAVAAPVAWALVDLWVTGDPLFSLHATSDLADELNRPRGLDEVPKSFFTFLGDTAREPVAVAGAIGMAVALGSARARERPVYVPLALFGAGALTFVATGVAGLSILPRYLTVPAVALCLFAAYAVVQAWIRAKWLVVAACAAAAIPVGVVGADRLDRLRTELRFTRQVHRDLQAVLSSPQVEAGRRCGPVTLPNYRLVPDARWILDASQREVGSRSARDRDRGVALFLIGEKPLRRYGFADGASPRTNVPSPGFAPAFRRGTITAYVSCPPR
jgi:hypothetical protein